MNWPLIILAIVVVAIAAYIVWAYNFLIRLRQRVHNSWAQIEVQLKYRHDLVPNLVETVKAYAFHETKLFEAVTEARSRALAAQTLDEQIQAEKDLEGAIRNVLAVAENYPELRASENFQKLQEELADIESKIAFTRQFYNDTVMKYQTAILSFPTNLIARVFNFQPVGYFEAEPESREVVPVTFQENG